MNILERAKKEAKKNGKKVSPEVAKGLNAIQAMHDLCKKRKGSPYKMYVSGRKSEIS